MEARYSSWNHFRNHDQTVVQYQPLRVQRWQSFFIQSVYKELGRADDIGDSIIHAAFVLFGISIGGRSGLHPVFLFSGCCGTVDGR